MASYTPVSTGEVLDETFANDRDQDDAKLHHKDVDHVASARHQLLTLQKSKQPLARLSSPDHTTVKPPAISSSTKQNNVTFNMAQEESDKIGVREKLL